MVKMSDKMSAQENDQLKRQICLMGDKENKWKKYLYLEDGVLVEEKFVKIENGIEIPCEEGPATHTVILPQNFENEEKLKVVNSITGEASYELKKTISQPQPQNVEFVKIYNETRNIGIITRLENRVQVSFQYYKVENNHEVICEPPEGDGKLYFVPLPDNTPNFSSHNGEISIYDLSTKTAVINIPKANIIQINNKTEIKIKEQNKEISDKIISKINELSNDEKEKLIENIQKTSEPVTTLEGKQVSISTIDQVTQTIGMILNNELEEIPVDFYKTIDPKEGFGISRVAEDKIYHLPRLLENAQLVRQGETTTYIIQSEVKDSYNNSIRLEHRLQATSPQEAEKIARLVLKRLKGIQIKIWKACWKMANTKSRYTFSCRLSELMKYSNPLREAHFNSAERVEFYEHLRSLENTKFVYTKSYKKKGKDKYESYEIRLLEIHRHSGYKDDEAPQEITMTILNTLALQKEKTTFVGVEIKNRTLELHADDAMLANIIQIRKNQQMKASYLKYERNYLMEIAGLSLTNKAKKAHANKLLIEKLGRLKEKGIIMNFPKRIGDTISLKVR
jgi:hypothetical protein